VTDIYTEYALHRVTLDVKEGLEAWIPQQWGASESAEREL
jgi:hypothetical protein